MISTPLDLDVENCELFWYHKSAGFLAHMSSRISTLCSDYMAVFSHCQVDMVDFRELYQYAQNDRGDIVFYDRFAHLCKERGISVSRAAMEAGISKSLVTKWKTNSVETPSPEVLQKLSKYFSIPISALLGEESPETTPSAQRNTVSDEDIQFALFGGNDAITEAMYEEVKQFAAFIKQREGYQK